MQIRLQATTETEVHSPQRCSDGDRKRERAREGECDLWSLCIAKSCHAPCSTRRQKLMEPHSHTHTHMRSMSCTHIHMHSVYGVAYNELDGQLGLTGTGAGVGAAAAVGSS